LYTAARVPNLSIVAQGGIVVGSLCGVSTDGLHVVGTTRNNIILVTEAARLENYAHAYTGNPTLIIHSANTMPIGADQWVSLASAIEHGCLKTGTGGQIMAPFNGVVYLDTAPHAKAVQGLGAYHEIISVNVASDTTAVTTIVGSILAAAIRVDEDITGLDSADHHIKLGIVGTTAKYCDAAQGGASTRIDGNTKNFYAGVPLYESVGLILTIDGGGDNIPNAGSVEVMVMYVVQDNMADV